MRLSRRRVLAVALLPVITPAAATPESLQAAVRAYTGGAPVQDGRVTIELAELVENGNAVPLAVQVQSALTATDHVRSIAVFTSHNPQPEVAVFHFSPRVAGRARVDTRIRLATSQRVLALATLSDGSVWRAQADVLVTLAACVES
ncbi:MAG: SoxY-related AACIE arm protein [Rubrivivax sp.]